MKKLLLAFLLVLAPLPAAAGVTCSLPFNLINGTTADASQVMANYNALVTCLTRAAAAGANNDITSLLALSTPLTPAQGGSVVFLGGTSGGAANAQVISSTTPSNFAFAANSQIIFKAGFTNTSATTLTVAGTTANLYKMSTAGPVVLTGNEIQVGNIVFAFYDGTQWQMLPPLAVTAGFGVSVANQTTVSISSSAPPFGFTAPVNMGITVGGNTPSANLLQVCMTDQAGVTPSASSPVLIPFQAGSPNVVWRAVTSQTCIDTNAAGATLGTQNSVPFRLWVLAFDNAGTVVLALWHSGAGAATPAINPLQEDLTGLSTTAIGAAATSAGVFYTPNGVTLSSKTFRIIAYVDYASGLATAGSYSTNPSMTTIFGPGLRKPGDVIQSVFGFGNNQSITPSSAINLVRLTGAGSVNATGSSPGITMNLKRGGSGGTSLQIHSLANNGANNQTSAAFPFVVLDNPQTTSSTNYDFSTCTNCTTSTTRSSLLLEEIMG